MRRIWQNENIGLVGRKGLLERKVKPRIDKGYRFVLNGKRGSGKTALLEASFDLCTDRKCLTSAQKALGDMLRQIVRDWEIEVDCEKSKPSVEEMRRAILQSAGNTLFVDDLEFAGSASSKIEFLKAAAERHRLIGAINGKPKEKIKPLYAKLGKEIYVQELSREDATRLAERVVMHFGSTLEAKQIVNSAHGLPDKVVTYASTNEIRRDEIREREDEIDIAPVFLFLMAGVMIFRYLGRVTESTDFVLLGGIGMLGLLVARGVYQKGKEK